MKKTALTSFTILFLLSSMFLLGCGFNIQIAKAGGTIYIRADGSVDPALAPIQRVGDTYFLMWHTNDSLVVERSNITVDGNGYVLQGSGSGKGIDLTATSNVTIRNIEIRTFSYGIWLYKPYQSSNCKIIESRITNNTYGIWIFASNNTLYQNTISGSGSGIVVDLGSFNNTVSGNDILNNTRGVRIIMASNNKLYHNNFINNTQQVDISPPGYANIWDDGYPSGGNCWNDYTGADLYSGVYQNETESDGIGDNPHSFDPQNQDNYPLMTPITPLYHEQQEMYNLLLADFQELNSTYHELLDDYSQLQSNYTTLNQTYFDLSLEHTLLQNKFNSLTTDYSELQQQYNSLNSTYYSLQASFTSLQAEFDEIQSEQEPIINELNNIRNIMYVFIAVTPILVAAIVYLGIRKPKRKPKTRQKKK